MAIFFSARRPRHCVGGGVSSHVGCRTENSGHVCSKPVLSSLGSCPTDGCTDAAPAFRCSRLPRLASPGVALPCLALPGLGWAGPGLKRPFPCCCSTRHLSCAHVPCGGTQQSSPTPTKGIARKLTSGTQAEPESKLPKLRNEAPEQSEESKRTLRA